MLKYCRWTFSWKGRSLAIWNLSRLDLIFSACEDHTFIFRHQSQYFIVMVIDWLCDVFLSGQISIVGSDCTGCQRHPVPLAGREVLLFLPRRVCWLGNRSRSASEALLQPCTTVSTPLASHWALVLRDTYAHSHLKIQNTVFGHTVKNHSASIQTTVGSEKSQQFLF